MPRLTGGAVTVRRFEETPGEGCRRKSRFPSDFSEHPHDGEHTRQTLRPPAGPCLFPQDLAHSCRILRTPASICFVSIEIAEACGAAPLCAFLRGTAAGYFRFFQIKNICRAPLSEPPDCFSLHSSHLRRTRSYCSAPRTLPPTPYSDKPSALPAASGRGADFQDRRCRLCAAANEMGDVPPAA